MPAAVERQHRRELLALEAKLDVGVVLEDHEVVLLRELDQPPPLVERERVAGRVLERGDDVSQRRAGARFERGSQSRDVDAVVLERDRKDLRAAVAQRKERAVVGRRLDHDEVAGLDEMLEQERIGLHRAVGHDHLLRRKLVLVGDPRAQGRVSDGRPIGTGAGGVVLERSLCSRLQVVDGDDVDRGCSACKRDGISHDGDVTESPDRHPTQAGVPAPSISAAISATSVGVWPTRTPFASSASFFAAAVPWEPEMIAPACPIVLPGGAVKPAMYANTGFETFSAMYSAVCSSASPPISPHMTINSVWSSFSNSWMMSMKCEPAIGSPPMPTIELLPKPRCASSLPIWYVSVPERDTRPTLPSLKKCAGMIPTFALPGERMPGQLGPTSRVVFVRFRCV